MSDCFSDFRSDTVTKPSLDMRRVMRDAIVGDDDYGDDPTVKKLEEKVASLLGKPSALFMPSGTQSNLVAILTHCQRGEEVITGKEYHIYAWEAGGASSLGGVIVNPLITDEEGAIDLDDLKLSIKKGTSHEPSTKLLSLENTFCGIIQPIEKMRSLSNLARTHNLSTHLDGARLANAVVKTGNSFSSYGMLFDTISVCLSKGLGAPIGSVLAGSPDFIERARRLRKQIGGGMRQSGISAAAGIFALEHNLQRLSNDHEHAFFLAEKLSQYSSFQVPMNIIHTNIVFADIEPEKASAMHKHLENDSIKVNYPEQKKINGKIMSRFRFVVHLDINEEDINKLIKSSSNFIK